MKLRYYQSEKMVIPAIKAIERGYSNIAVIAQTGAGKTAVLVWWANEAYKKGKRILIIVHKETIMKQFMKTCHAFGLPYGHIKSGSPILNIPIQIAMVGTLVNKVDQIPTVDWILGDEVHHWGVSNQWGKIVKHFKERTPKLKTLGVTATPNGLTSGRGLHPFFDYMVNELSMEYLVSEGWLAFPHTMTGEKIDMPKIKKVNGEYDKTQQFIDHWSKKEIIGEYINSYQEYGNGLPFIISCSGLKHASHVQREYEKYASQNGKSWKAVFVQGGKKYEKQLFDAIEGMASGSVQLLTFDSVFGEGVDVPYCCGVQWLRKTGSLVNWLQYNGRSLRPIWPEGFDQYNSTVGERLEAISKSVKPIARIQDFAGNFEEHGHPISNHPWTLDDTRIKGKNQMTMPQYSKCDKCRGVWPGKPKICPGSLPNGDMCENPLNTEETKKGRKPPKVIDGILKEAGAGGDADKIYEMMSKASQLQSMSEEERRKYIISMVHRNGTNMETKKMAEVLGYEISGKWTDKVYKRVRKKR